MLFLCPSLSVSILMSQRRQWHPTPALLPGKSHGQRNLVGCSPWGHEESDMTEQLHFHFSLSCIGEGNGNLLQYSCLEIPRDGGAWWAAVYGVAQSWTWLKWLSSILVSMSVHVFYLCLSISLYLDKYLCLYLSIFYWFCYSREFNYVFWYWSILEENNLILRTSFLN